jgi:hypothetical protein
MSLCDLAYVMAAESLADEWIEQTNPQGPTPMIARLNFGAAHGSSPGQVIRLTLPIPEAA